MNAPRKLRLAYRLRRWRLAWWWYERWGWERGMKRPPMFFVGGPKVMASAAAPRRSRSKPNLVDDLVAFVRRFVVMTDEQLLVIALWIIHTHCVQATDQTPYLAVTSPEKQCGKSRLLEVLDLLVARPWMTILPSEAVLFRQIHNNHPTLLLDETDTIFNPRSAERYEGHRALLNAGHRRGAMVPRCIGTSNKIVQFHVFCPKVLAGIGTLPDTVADRSVPIRLARRKRDEKVERFIRRKVKPKADGLLARIEQWADSHADNLRNARPEMPEELDDRMQEGCESLVAIAEELGIGDKARAALIELLTGERLDDQESLRLRLLRDTRTIFEAEDAKRNGNRVSGIFTATLLTELSKIEEAPWRGYYGRGLEARDVATLLHHYGIKPTTLRSRGKGDQIAKGYKRDDLHEAWDRYLD